MQCPRSAPASSYSRLPQETVHQNSQTTPSSASTRAMTSEPNLSHALLCPALSPKLRPHNGWPTTGERSVQYLISTSSQSAKPPELSISSRPRARIVELSLSTLASLSASNSLVCSRRASHCLACMPACLLLLASSLARSSSSSGSACTERLRLSFALSGAGARPQEAKSNNC